MLEPENPVERLVYRRAKAVKKFAKVSALDLRPIKGIEEEEYTNPNLGFKHI